MPELRSPFGPALTPFRAADLSVVLKALADPGRLRIVNLLHEHGEMTTMAVTAALGTLRQPTVTYHLQTLDAAGLLTCRSVGRIVYRRLRLEAFSTLATLLTPGGDRW